MADCLSERLHNPARGLPHWSESVAWPADRWDPMSNAPRAGYPILHIRTRNEGGRVSEPVHYACGDGDGMMPSFDGWFAAHSPDMKGGFYQIDAVEWQPIHAGQSAAGREPTPSTKEI